MRSGAGASIVSVGSAGGRREAYGADRFPCRAAREKAWDTVSTSSARPAGWTDLDDRAVAIVRGLAMDAVAEGRQRPPGHRDEPGPGWPTCSSRRSCGTTRPTPDWVGRDRFVLSCGHSSLTLYIQLYLSGYGLELGDLRVVPHLGLADARPPRVRPHRGRRDHHRPARPGPRQRRSGMAMAARRERGLFDPDAAPGDEPVRPPRLRASPPTATSRRASPARRPRWPAPSGWATSSSSGTTTTSRSRTTPPSPSARTRSPGTRPTAGTPSSSRRCPPARSTSPALAAALDAARTETDRPSFIAAPHHHRLAGAHAAEHRQGARLGSRRGRGRGHQGDARARPRPAASRSTTTCWRTPALVKERGAKTLHATGSRARHAGGPPSRTARRCSTGCSPASCPAGWTDALPTFPADPKGMATRKASGEVLNALGPVLPELWGGSADLAESNNTTIEGVRLVPADRHHHTAVGGRRPVRPHAALRHPRARHGRDPERDRAARAAPARTAAPSSSSATTCAAPCGWPRSCSCPSPTSGRTTRSGSARTARPTSRSSTCPRCARSPACPSSARATPTRRPWPGARSCAGSRPVGLALTRQNVPTLDRAVLGSADGRRARRLRAGRGLRRQAAR